MTTFAAIQSIAVTAAAVVAAYVGLKGLSTWKKQLAGHNEYDVARRLLRSAYALEGALARVRSVREIPPDSDSAEDDKGELGEEDQTQWIRDQQSERRWDIVERAELDFHSDLSDARVLWGDSIREKGNHLLKLAAEYRFNLFRNRRHETKRSERRSGGASEEDIKGSTAVQISRRAGGPGS